MSLHWTAGAAFGKQVDEMQSLWTQEDIGGARVLTLRRAAKRNSLSREARAQLEELVSRAGASKAGVVVVTGEGERAFCAGADLEERSGMSEEDVRVWLDDLRRTFRAIEESPKVFIAAVNGAALGGGLELALACDLRVAGRDATLGLPEARLAILPGGGGTQRLARLVGPGRARDLIFTGRAVGAEEALAIGLIERVAPAGPGAALQESLRLAEEIAACGPLALSSAKEALLRGLDEPLERGLDIERECYEAILHSSDRIEGIAAFREKRRPNYRGE